MVFVALAVAFSDCFPDVLFGYRDDGELQEMSTTRETSANTASPPVALNGDLPHLLLTEIRRKVRWSPDMKKAEKFPKERRPRPRCVACIQA